MKKQCKDLVQGTSRERRGAWRHLVEEGALWQGCLLTDAAGSSLEELQQAYEDLSTPAAVQAVQALDSGAAEGERLDKGERERLLNCLQRLTAAGVVARLIRHYRNFARQRGELERWVIRAAGLCAEAVVGYRVDEKAWDEKDAALARRCFAGLSTRCLELGHLAAAQAAVLMLLGEKPQRRLGNVPLLLVRNGTDGLTGQVARLALDLWTDGYGQLFSAPPMLRSFGPAWQEAIATAWRRVPFRPRCDVQWEVAAEASQLDGASAQASFQVALTCLWEGFPYDSQCALSARVDASGQLCSVQGLVDLFQGVGPKLLAAKRAEVRRVVLSPADFQGLSAVAREGLKAAGVSLLQAATVKKALSQVHPARTPGRRALLRWAAGAAVAAVPLAGFAAWFVHGSDHPMVVSLGPLFTKDEPADPAFDRVGEERWLHYTETVAGSVLRIAYAMPYLEKYRQGGPVAGVEDALPFAWHYPNLAVRITNPSRRDLVPTRATLQVSESRLDESPLLVVLKETENLWLENEGWGEVIDPVVHFRITPAEEIEAPQVDREPMKTSRPVFCPVETRQMWKLRLDNDVPASLEEKENVRVAGFLEYGPAERRQSVRFATLVRLQPAAQHAVPPAFQHHVLLEAGKTQIHSISLSEHVISPGETELFYLRIGSDRTATYRLRLTVYADGERAIGRQELELNVFVPRSQAARAVKNMRVKAVTE